VVGGSESGGFIWVALRWDKAGIKLFLAIPTRAHNQRLGEGRKSALNLTSGFYSCRAYYHPSVKRLGEAGGNFKLPIKEKGH
jgi:hypothetical protein